MQKWIGRPSTADFDKAVTRTSAIQSDSFGESSNDGRGSNSVNADWLTDQTMILAREPLALGCGSIRAVANAFEERRRAGFADSC